MRESAAATRAVRPAGEDALRSRALLRPVPAHGEAGTAPARSHRGSVPAAARAAAADRDCHAPLLVPGRAMRGPMQDVAEDPQFAAGARVQQ
ncbi:hypothetical protein G6F32_017088 [Rhizopus arrhizus]|nr:hypothetical protein G6F32_017088 [Rhizopus arrhizus]